LQIQTVIDHDLKVQRNGWCLLAQIKQKSCYFQIRIFQNSILHLMKHLFLLQIITSI
jgi:hypothetical protein